MSRPVQSVCADDFAELTEALEGKQGTTRNRAYRAMQRTRAQRTRRIRGN